MRNAIGTFHIFVRMKKAILFLSLTWTTIAGFGQYIQTADYYVGLGERFLYKKQTDSAVWAFKYVLENFPNKNQECSRAMFRLAGTYEKDSAGMALKWYNRIISSEKVNDRDKGMELLEPYANYRHNACLRVAAIQTKRKNYDDALRACEMALQIFKFQTYVGNSFENKMVNIALTQSELYKQLGYQDSAIYILVQKILDTDIKCRLPEMDNKSTNEVDFYGKISVQAAKMIDQLYGLGPFKYELTKAMNKMKVKKDKVTGFTICTFKLYNITFRITNSQPGYKKANFISDFKNSKLWAELDKG